MLLSFIKMIDFDYHYEEFDYWFLLSYTGINNMNMFYFLLRHLFLLSILALDSVIALLELME